MAKIELNSLCTVETELLELNSIEQEKVSGGKSSIIASSTASNIQTTYTSTLITSVDADGNFKTVVDTSSGSSKGFEKVTSQPIDDAITTLSQKISF
jgi:hypothetical protein